MPIVVIVVIGLILFFPVYDLEIATDREMNNYIIVEENFFTLSSCTDAVDNYPAYDYVCLKKTLWGQLTNSYSKYDSKHR